MRYRVELDELAHFVDRLQSFEQRAESVAARVDSQVCALHSTWSGDAAAAHKARHDEWVAGAAQMRAAVTQLRSAAHDAHHHYTDAARMNVAMLT